MTSNPNYPKTVPHDRTKGDPDRPIPNPDPPRPDGNTGDGKGPHYTPWLVVRYASGDDGSRPLPSGSVFWESPDVWTQGSQGTNQPVAGEATQVFTRVTNLGLQDANAVTLKYWWANPSIGISEATAHLIATDTVAVPAGNSLVFQSPADWVPVVENGGHECLLVEAYVQVFDPLVSPMDPVDDRHVGQKNENLVLLQPGQMFRFQLDAHNFTRLAQEVVVEARRGVIPRRFAQKFAGRGLAGLRLFDPVQPLPIEIGIAGEPVRTVGAARLLANPITGETRAAGCLPPPQVSKSAVFKPGEVRRVAIEAKLPPAAEPGEVYVTRVIQRIGTVVTGGYTIYAMIDPRR